MRLNLLIVTALAASTLILTLVAPRRSRRLGWLWRAQQAWAAERDRR